jgi:hypothetical protein
MEASLPRRLTLLASLLFGGCGRTIVLLDEDGGSSDEPSTTTATSATTTGHDPMETTRGPGTTDHGTDVGGDATDDTDVPPPSPDLGACGELGAPCLDGTECCNGECFMLASPLGGVCSLCDSDEDCRFGCEDGWPLDLQPAFCGDGSSGSDCETSDACGRGLLCALLIDTAGVVERTCGQCIEDADCPAGLECAPTYTSFVTGYHECIPPGSRPLDAGCGGDEECSSGSCAVAYLEGLPFLTICAECNDSEDCGGADCIAPAVSVGAMGFALESGHCA